VGRAASEEESERPKVEKVKRAIQRKKRWEAKERER
jgi:hypothetical protein